MRYETDGVPQRYRGPAYAVGGSMLLGALILSGCLWGCAIQPMTADQLFGGAAHAPKARVEYGRKGFAAEIGTNFTGKMDGRYNPETKEATLSAEVSSDASGVLEQYPNWLGAMLPAQQAMLAANVELNKLQVEKHRLVGENVKAVGTMLSMAAAAGGDAFAKMIDSTAPILRGSGLSLEGFGAANLGTPIPVTPTPAVPVPVVPVVPASPNP